MTTTIKFTGEDLCNILADHLRREGYMPVGDVSIRTGSRTKGHGPSEHEETFFDCASVEVEAEPVRMSPTSSSSLGTQIASVESGNITER